MRRIDIKDRFIFIFNFTPFTLLKFVIFNTILRLFIRGLNDSEIRKKVTREITSSDHSLRNIYNLAEKARHINFEI